ncbi:hypothetical protein [Polyangium aurulentum]|uniref:hypothetical protein n=1 Tax=Polyangium aurulentum TaxID=2567896 RepID=UPI001F3E5115|nr:hypothetical protein [Polyangium aurulentum]
MTTSNLQGRPLLALALVCAALAGCTPPQSPKPAPLPGPVATTPESAPATGPSEPAPAASPQADGLRPGALAPRVSVAEVQGADDALANSIVAPSKAPMDACRANAGGGLVRIRISGDQRSTSMAVEPGSSVDGRTRRCVLEALSTIDVPDTLSQTSPSSRPSKGFSSVITVQW